MSTLTQQAISVHTQQGISPQTQQAIPVPSPHSPYVNSFEVSASDMDHTDEAVYNQFTSQTTQPSPSLPVEGNHMIAAAQLQTSQSLPSEQLSPPSQAASTSDLDMEGGQDTTGISPSPWEVVQPAAQSQPRSATPHIQASTPPFPTQPPQPPQPAAVADRATTPTLPANRIAHNGTTLLIEPVDPSPDIHLADNPAMSLHNHLLPGNGPPAFPPHVPREHAEEDDDDESSADDDEEEEDGPGQAQVATHTMQFYPIREDTSLPSADEQRIIDASEEHSAHDHDYWRAKTFFPIKDAEILPDDDGIIEWTIDSFNGTQENPRKELLIRSPTVRIGIHEWRIKLLPRGHLSTDRISAYVECLSVQDASLDTEWPEDQLPLPKIGNKKLLKRRAVPAQVSVLLYNPDEPRVHEFHTDAHQFHSGSPDHGWARFTTMPWYDLHRRNYAYRQPLLRNDRLAVKAFIRVIYDPTDCLWAHKDQTQGFDPVATIGLQDLPTFDNPSITPVLALLLHLGPFRTILYHLGKNPPAEEAPFILPLLQSILYRMRSRDPQPLPGMCSEYEHDYMSHCFENERDSHDVMEMMNDMVGDVRKQLETLVTVNNRLGRAAQLSLNCFKDLFGANELQFSGSRKTKLSILNKPTMQHVVDAGKKSLACLNSPQLLTIELDRQVFDREKRCWKKLLNKVRLDDEITVNGTVYELYGFVSHTGYLQNGRYSAFFRPNGLGNLWYTYKDSAAGRSLPKCMTKKQAVSPREGVKSNTFLEESAVLHDRSSGFPSFGPSSGEEQGVAYIVLYLRNDVASETFYMDSPEPWNVPRVILTDFVEEISDDSDQEGEEEEDAPAVTAAANGLASTAAGSAPDDDVDMKDDLPDNPPPSSQQVANSIADGLTHTQINYLSKPHYNGTIKNNEYHGHGHLIYLNGDEYTGWFSDGCRDGHGDMTYSNGDTYSGSWKLDQHHGHGTYTEARTGNVYEGHFEAGKKSGEGVTKWKMSEEQARLCQVCYSADVDTAFYDCGHVVCCGTCARSVETCPVCRRRIRDVLKLFYTA